MATKSGTAEALQFETIDKWRPSQYNGFGFFRIPKVTEVPGLDLNTYKCAGKVREVKIDENDDFDEETQQFHPINTILSDSEDEDVIAHLSEEELSKMVLEKSSKNAVGVWMTSLPCPASLFGSLIGKNGVTKKKFEDEYEVKVQFVESQKQQKTKGPQQLRRKVWLAKEHDEGEVILRHESSRNWLFKARAAMGELILLRLTNLPYTHFISLPFLRRDNEDLCRNLDLFRQRVLESSNVATDKIEPSLFQEPGQSHFTLCMLRLYFDHQMDTAMEVLESLPMHPRLQAFFEGDHQIPDIGKSIELPASGFHVELEGVYMMEDDWAHAHVLYTQERRHGSPTTLVSQERRRDAFNYEWLAVRRSAESFLTVLADVLYQAFCDKGLLDYEELSRQRLLSPTQETEVKFHMTLMNSKFRDPTSVLLKGLEKGNNVPRLPYNADSILRKFKMFKFGVGKITGLHLSRRGAPAADTAYYHAEKIIPICHNRGM